MINVDSLIYMGPFMSKPNSALFETLLRCNTEKGELISKNLIIGEGLNFNPRPFPLKREERISLVEKYLKSFDLDSTAQYLCVDAFAQEEEEGILAKMIQTVCLERDFCLMLLVEEARIAIHQICQLEHLFSVAHLNEINSEGIQLPVHLHMLFRVKENQPEEKLKAMEHLVIAGLAKICN